MPDFRNIITLYGKVTEGMSKKYPNMNDSSDEPELKRRRSLNPFENMFRRDGKGVEKDEVKVYYSFDDEHITDIIEIAQAHIKHQHD